MNSKFARLVFVCALAAGFGFAARAEVRLPALFSDNMVLQRDARVPVWGWADEGEVVTVRFGDQIVKAKTKGGKWMATLKNLKVGEPGVLIVQGRNHIEIKNVVVGEVWVCSGQSNMELALKNSLESASDIANSANPKLRLIVIPKVKSDKPLDDVKAQWKESNPETSPGFSAVAWYFGRALQQSLNVPVGLIDTCWGGSPAEVWMSQKKLASNPDYKRDILDAYQGDSVKLGTNVLKRWKPCELYNGMIAPLIPFAIKGAIWYQGESNAPRAKQYRSLFADMIRNWRQDWDEGKFPFMLVQLAPYDQKKQRSIEEITAKPVESNWAELREAQLLSTKALPKVGMAVITDIGEKDDIHPKKKQPVGERLALAARGIAYGEKVEYSGPIYKSMKVKDGKAIISFTHAGCGLEARDGELKGFAICGPDKKFVWGKAEIEGDKVVVSSPEVSQPVAVRYGWDDFPVVNLWNKADLPASPFRTDDFPMVTDKGPKAEKK